MVPEFQALPPQEPLIQPKKPLKQLLREHKTGVIVASIAVVLLMGMGAYIVSPARQTIVAPASDERTDTGTILPTKSPPSQNSSVIISTPTPQPTSIPNTAWLTYTNSTYGYSIKYPPDWIFQNIGQLEPKVPSYIAFQPPTASSSARLITVTISTRTYSEQLALGSSSSAVTVAGITGTRQYFQDSDGRQSTAVILPRSSNLLILRTKSEYLSIFNLMLTTLTSTK